MIKRFQYTVIPYAILEGESTKGQVSYSRGYFIFLNVQDFSDTVSRYL